MDNTATEILGNAESLILDMRANPGGYTKTLKRWRTGCSIVS